ncbi:IS1634 family transposase [Patescibacteria group bacterium AH-259-L07]|nr:IS1634 family transposase [Patescibacteria group bacterium AH-259-L07]
MRKKTIKRKGKTYHYLQVVENQWNKGRVRQKLILSLGEASSVDKTYLEKLTTCLSDLVPHLELIRLNIDESIAPVWSKEYGAPSLYHHLFKQTHLHDIISQISKAHKIQFNLTHAVFLLLLNRLLQPCSEHKTIQWAREIYHQGFRKLQLHHLYRTLDVVHKHKQEIEQKLFERGKDLFHQEIDLAFFDTTSTYLSGGRSTELVHYGYSKDRRSDKKQIVIGVLLGRNSIPIGCEIFPGNTTDVHTFVRIINSVTKRFRIKQIIIVSDGGMNSKNNIKLLEQEKLDYILGTRLRNVKQVKEYLMTHQGSIAFTPVVRPQKDGQTKTKTLGVAEVFLKGKRYVMGYNHAQAVREQKSREQMVEKLTDQLKKKGIKSLIKNRGYQRLLTVKKGANTKSFQIDYDKLKQEQAFDGIFVCQTNTDLDAQDVILQYKNLWIIERAFRQLKDILEVRPMYHQTDRRVEAHVFISFLALYLEMILRKKLHNHGLSSLDDQLQAVRQIKAVKIRINQKQGVLRTELPEKAYQVFQALHMRPPNRIVEQWRKRAKT